MRSIPTANQTRFVGFELGRGKASFQSCFADAPSSKDGAVTRDSLQRNLGVNFES